MKKILILLATAACTLAASASRTDTITVPSPLIPQPMKVTVITPTTGQKDYPTVYLLNGYDGDYRAWTIVRPDLPELADRYGMVMVMPSGMDSWYWDSPVDSTMQMESFITTELVPYIDKNFPTRPRPEYRAITGLSMGGHGALTLATKHPDIWANAGSTSGGVDIRPFTKKWKIEKWLGSQEQYPERWNNETVAGMLPRIKANGTNIIFDCGAQDFFAGVNDKLHRDMLQLEIPHDYISRPGTHNRQYWNNAIQYHLMFFNDKFNNAGKK